MLIYSLPISREDCESFKAYSFITAAGFHASDEFEGQPRYPFTSFLYDRAAMATQPTQPKGVRKRDLAIGFFKDLPRSISSFRRRSSPSTMPTRPGTPNAPLQSQSGNMDLGTGDKKEVEGQKAFVKSESFEKDLAQLYASFVLQNSSHLKEIVMLIAAIRDNNTKAELDDVLETCARFVVQLASAPEDNRVEAEQALEDFRGTIIRVRKVQLGEDSIPTGNLRPMIEGEIAKIKPAFLSNAHKKSSEGLTKVLDVTIGSTISVMKVVESASSLIPVPLVQPVVAQVITMLEAVQQTRSNYNEMKAIASKAGNFAVSCAVTLSESRASPPERLQRTVDQLTRELEGIARECGILSQQGLFQRYLNQDSQATGLQAISDRLDQTIRTFQDKLNLSVKLDTEVIIKKLDSAALQNLPVHPYMPEHEYFEKSRDDVLKYVLNWVVSAPEPILWIHGPAGLGKSTVARQLIEVLQRNDRFAGGILLTYVAKAHPVDIVKMIARQLGGTHPPTVGAIVEAAGRLGPHGSLEDYLRTHVIDPISSLKYPYQLIVVMDGLDEWPDRGTFLKGLKDIPVPSPVKFILTSRFSYDIERILNDTLVHKYRLPPASQAVLEQYFSYHFTSDDIDWRERRPDQHRIRRLATLADGLLIWAATVRALVSSISDGRFPHVILDDILYSGERMAGKNGEQLEALYRDALSGPLFPPDNQDRLRDYLGAILVLQEPLHFPDFARLVRKHIPEIILEDIHHKLAALRLRDDTKSLDIFPARQSYHASFIQFIQDGAVIANSTALLFQKISATDAHLALGKMCIELVFKQFLPSFRGRTVNYTELNSYEQYAVKFWPLHLASGTARDSPASEAALTNVTTADLNHWAAIFLPHVAPQVLNGKHDLNVGASKSELLCGLGMLIGTDDDSTLMYHLHCLELSVRLQSQKAEIWTALGSAYARIHKKGGSKQTLEQQIFGYHQALDLCPAPHPDRSSSLNNLANGLQIRFEQQGAPADLSDTISLYREALDLLPTPHSDRSLSLNNLANALRIRFEQQGAPTDLSEAISLHREALDLCPAPHPDRSMSLNNLASALQTRFEQQGAPADLSEAIFLHREALDLRPAPHPDRSMSLNNLASALQTRFEQQGSLADLREAISLHREALHLHPTHHPDRSMALNNLANALRTHFGQQGAPADLSEAIFLHREALDLRPAPHPDRSMSLNNLASALQTRFEQQGAPADLSEAIFLHREALDLRPAPHPDRSMSLNNLASALRTRFKQHHAPEDLSEAISLLREALQLCPAPHPFRWKSLANLGNCLHLQFKQSGLLTDLQEANLLHKETISLSLPSSPQYPSLLRCLLLGLELYFESTSLPEILTELIMLCQQFINHPSVTSEDWSWASEGLSTALRKRYELNGNTQDLEEADEIDRSLASKNSESK